MTDTSPALHLGSDTSFARAFETAWAKPTVDNLTALMQPDVKLIQPSKPPIIGRDAAGRDFQYLLDWLPGLHGIIERSVSVPGHCMIEYRLIAPIGRNGTTMRAVDTFLLKDNLIVEREVYYDTGTLRTALLKHPWRIPGFLRYARAGRSD